MKKNQGFSLVELIVVIAIMAILVGVVAPAYLRYVEKSRKSTDVSAISDIMAAAEKVAIDPQFDLASGVSFVVTKTAGSATVSVGISGQPAACQEWAILCGNASATSAESSNVYTMKSKDFTNSLAISYTGTIQPSGSVTWGTNPADAMTTFSPDFQKKWWP